MTLLRAGLIGQHISRSRLRAALEIMCAEAGWTLDFTLIDTADLEEFDFAATVDQARLDGWHGVTVTHPFKREARDYASDGMRADLAHLGASNLLTFKPGITGHNTDYTGFLAAWTHADLPAPGRVLMMGAGGVAEALAPALATLGAQDIAIHDLDPARAEDLAQATGGPARAIPASALPEEMAQAQGLVNATPLGMAEHPGSAFDPQGIGAQTWAFDAVYTPTRTAFLTACGQAGLTCLTGFDLFRAMAVRTFEGYTGLTVDQAQILPQLDRLRPE